MAEMTASVFSDATRDFAGVKLLLSVGGRIVLSVDSLTLSTIWSEPIPISILLDT